MGDSLFLTCFFLIVVLPWVDFDELRYQERIAWIDSVLEQVQILPSRPYPMRQKLFSVRISDCRVDTFCTGGHGGQNQNAKQMGVRITHPPSGAVGECREERHQHVNKVRAFTRMAESAQFRAWARMVASELSTGKSVDACVDEEMDVKNLRVDVKDEDGRWTPEMKLVS